MNKHIGLGILLLVGVSAWYARPFFDKKPVEFPSLDVEETEENTSSELETEEQERAVSTTNTKQEETQASPTTKPQVQKAIPYVEERISPKLKMLSPADKQRDGPIPQGVPINTHFQILEDYVACPLTSCAHFLNNGGIKHGDYVMVPRRVSGGSIKEAYPVIIDQRSGLKGVWTYNVMVEFFQLNGARTEDLQNLGLQKTTNSSPVPTFEVWEATPNANITTIIEQVQALPYVKNVDLEIHFQKAKTDTSPYNL